MLNKNGFISTAVIYTFFFVFLMMLLYIINDFVDNRLYLSNIKTDIKNNLTDTNFSYYLINRYLDPNINMTNHSIFLLTGANDNSYRYEGANPNNYVCFGSVANPCPAENVYRIIGIFNNRVKLIRNLPVSNDTWDLRASTAWQFTMLYEYLNNTFLNTFSGEWQSKIDTAKWYGLSFPEEKIALPAKTLYLEEVGNVDRNYSHPEGKIGLMYISDYAFAAENSLWANNLTTYSVTSSKNWLFNGGNQWTVTSLRDGGNLKAYYVSNTGDVRAGLFTDVYQVRPTFYLSTQTQIQSGTGKSNDPYRIIV